MTVLRRGSKIAAWEDGHEWQCYASLVVCRYRGAPSRHGGASEAARRHRGLLYRPTFRRLSFLGNRGAPEDRIETAEEARHAALAKIRRALHGGSIRQRSCTRLNSSSVNRSIVSFDGRPTLISRPH